MSDPADDPRDTLDRLASLGAAPDGGPDLCGGVVIGNFQLQVKLGRGGMGEVWKAWDAKAERTVVLKFVPPELQHAGEEMARVKATFQRIHALQDRHICPVYLLDEDRRFGWYLVMKYIDGQTLSAYRATYVARHGAFPVEQVVKVLCPVAEALDYAHAQKVIHRDVKPQNILVVGDAEDVQIVDFGLAAEICTTLSRVSQQQMDTSGTRPYMAPEQWKGQPQDARTDQYALAVVAYELISGRLPFESADFDILRACVLNDPPEEIEGQTTALNQALTLGLAKRRQERFGSCRGFVQSLAASPGAGQTVATEDPRRPCPACGQELRLKPSAAGKELPCPYCKTVLKVAADLKQMTVRAGAPHNLQISSTIMPTVAAGGNQPMPVAPAEMAVTEKLITNSIGMKLALIPAGEFMMGSPESEQDRGSDEIQHPVRITKPFYLGVFPVTQAEYKQVMGTNPSLNSTSLLRMDTSRFPVENVSWEDAMEFCRRLSQKEGKEYRLPTEAQWEYACRAGTTTPFHFGSVLNGREANCDGDYPYGTDEKGPFLRRPTPVGSYRPNRFGLYDMHGNVCQWCADWQDLEYYGNSPIDDPPGPPVGSLRVIRGGGHYESAGRSRSAYRGAGSPRDQRRPLLGFRVSLVPADK